MSSPQISAAAAFEIIEERHFTISEIARLWRVSHETARRLFQNEPGVLRLNHPSAPTSGPIRHTAFRKAWRRAFGCE